MRDFSNFHDDTTANFTPCEIPTRSPDFVSPSGSLYWDEGDAVVRASNHDDGARYAKHTLIDLIPLA